MKKVTITDIAKAAGVSRTTVSFAFNYPERLPEETVQRIMEVAEALDFIPSPVARSFSTGRTGVLGVLLPMRLPDILPSPFMSEFLWGVGEVCAESGLSIMLVPPIEGSMERAIVSAAVDGFLTLGVEYDTAAMEVLQRREVPFVMVDSDPSEGVTAVNVDDEGGGRRAMSHILEAGHRNIVILSILSELEGRYQEYPGTLGRRMKGYLAALADYGLDLDGQRIWLLECPSTASGGYDGFKRVWENTHRPTAFVAMSDIIAIGALEAAHQAGVRIPEDLSVIGFDDVSFAASVYPPLTTISQPIYRKGQLAAQLLTKHINGESEVSQHVLPTRLVVRQSVGPPSE